MAHLHVCKFYGAEQTSVLIKQRLELISLLLWSWAFSGMLCFRDFIFPFSHRSQSSGIPGSLNSRAVSVWVKVTLLCVPSEEAVHLPYKYQFQEEQGQLSATILWCLKKSVASLCPHRLVNLTSWDKYLELAFVFNFKNGLLGTISEHSSWQISRSRLVVFSQDMPTPEHS